MNAFDLSILLAAAAALLALLRWASRLPDPEPGEDEPPEPHF